MKNRASLAVLVLGLLSTLGAASVWAVEGLPGKITRVDADYRCEKKGGGVAFRQAEGEKSPARVWQIDLGEEMGLELEVLDFKTFRCPGCYEFTARLGADLVTYGKTSIPPGGSLSKMALTYSAIDPKTKKMELIGEFPCVLQKRR